MSMTYEDMLARINEASIYVQGYELKREDHHMVRKVTGQEYIEVDWTSGGLTGGNCYGDRPHRAAWTEDPRDLEDLDKILEVLVPNISYLQFKKIDKRVQTGTREESADYYGNYYVKSYKVLKIKDLYEVLVEMNLI